MNSSPPRALKTRRGDVRFPAYLPVTTFGDRYPLDDLIRPYLSRLASAVMVSFHYARQMTDPPRLPLFVDSGGFASLFENARICVAGEVGVLELQMDDGVERLHPVDVLDLQERIAEVAFTLDFPIPPGMEEKEAHTRQTLTIQNAHWALRNLATATGKTLPLSAASLTFSTSAVRDYRVYEKRPAMKFM